LISDQHDFFDVAAVFKDFYALAEFKCEWQWIDASELGFAVSTIDLEVFQDNMISNSFELNHSNTSVSVHVDIERAIPRIGCRAGDQSAAEG
jgi:hypothetical protein